MDSLFRILEEPQSVLQHGNDLPFELQDSSHLSFPAINNTAFLPVFSPSLTPVKLIAHKSSSKISAKKRSWKKPKDKPKRPLSAYNLFFQHHREQIIAVLPDVKSVSSDGLTEDQLRRKHRKTHGKIGFADLARSIALKWKTIEKAERSIFQTRADAERQKYKKKLEVWKKVQQDLEGEKPKPPPKKKATVLANPSPSSRMKAPSIPQYNDALTSMITSSTTAQRAHLLQFMMNNQQMNMMAQPSMNMNMNPLQMHEASYQNFSPNNVFYQRQQQQQHQYRYQHINLQNQHCGGYAAMDPRSMIDLTTPSPEPSPVRRHATETFLKDSFFEDIPPTQHEAPEAYSAGNSEKSSFDDDIHDFMYDFDDEILLS